MLFEDDLSLHYTLNGDPVSVPGIDDTVFGLFSEPGQMAFGGEVVMAEPTLRYPVETFPAMPRHTELSVAGRRWRTRAAPRLLGDGREAVVELELWP